MLRFVLTTALLVAVPFVRERLRADEVQAALPKADAFFAGTVVESASDKITVTRIVLGRSENRTFLRTADTRVEGKIAPTVRVTVRYVTDETGDTATMIIVRPPAPAPRDKKKK